MDYQFILNVVIFLWLIRLSIISLKHKDHIMILKSVNENLLGMIKCVKLMVDNANDNKQGK